jgi:hypothetical protein
MRTVGRIGIVPEHLRHDRTSDKRLEFGLEGVSLTPFVNLVATDIERKGPGIFRLLRGVIHGFLVKA